MPAPCWRRSSATSDAAFLQIGDGAIVVVARRADGWSLCLLAAARRVRQHHQLHHRRRTRSRRWSFELAPRAGRRGRALHRRAREPGAAQGGAGRCTRRSSTACSRRSARSAASGVDAGAVAGARRLPVEPRRSTSAPTTTRRWSWPRARQAQRMIGRRSHEVVEADGAARSAWAQARPGRRGRDLRARRPSPALVAKIFHQPLPATARREDPGDGRRCARRRSSKLTAWPIGLLSLPGGQPIGVKMPRVDRPSRHPSALQPEEPPQRLPARRLALPRAGRGQRGARLRHGACRGRRHRRRQSRRHPGRRRMRGCG